MKKKRLLMLVASILTVISVIAGCTAPSAAPSASAAQGGAATAEPTVAPSAAAVEEIAPGSLPISKEKINLKFFWPCGGNVLKTITDFNENPVFQELEKQTNIHFEFNHGGSDSVAAFNLMLNSGELADIIFQQVPANYYPGGGDKAIADGAYLKLNEYLDKYCLWYPKVINSSADIKRDSRTDAGNIWAFCMIEPEVQGAWMGMTVRQDWLDDLGISTPVTYDDWHSMLAKFKSEKKASAPLLLPKNIFPWTDNFIAGYQVGQGFYQVDKKIKYGPLEPGFKGFITMLAQWYKEGLIDPDFATRDDASMNQLKYTSQAGAWYDGFWVLENNKKLAQDSSVFHQVSLPDPVLNLGDVCHLRQTNYNVRTERISVSAKSKYTIEAVRWLDNCYSDANTELINYGVGETCYTKKSDGKYYPTDLLAHNPDGLTHQEAQTAYLMEDGPFIRKISRDDSIWTPDELACYDSWDKADSAYVLPQVSLTADEATTNSTIMNDITTYVTETCTKYIMGVEDLSTFDSFVERIKSMNIDQAIAVQQAALDRWYNR